jgi:hypothetical protein
MDISITAAYPHIPMRTIKILTLVVLLSLALPIASASAGSSSSISLSRNHLPYEGGSVIVHLSTANLGACSLTITPEVGFLPFSDCAAGGTIRVSLLIPFNTSRATKRYVLHFSATGTTTATSQILVKGSPAPVPGGKVTVIDDWFATCNLPHYSFYVEYSNGQRSLFKFTTSSPGGTTFYNVIYNNSSLLLKYPLTFGYSTGNGPGVIIASTSQDTAVNHCQD